MPPSSEEVKAYTGTFINDLTALVASVEEAKRTASEMVTLNRLQVLRDEADVAVFLADVKLHIANHEMTQGDVQAWWLMDDFQQSFWAKKTRICMHCSMLEGFHHPLGYCQNVSMGWYSVAQRFEPALCDVEDQFGNPCGRDVTVIRDGQGLCPKHAD